VRPQRSTWIVGRNEFPWKRRLAKMTFKLKTQPSSFKHWKAPMSDSSQQTSRLEKEKNSQLNPGLFEKKNELEVKKVPYFLSWQLWKMENTL
jgi:hypothetical protein